MSASRRAGALFTLLRPDGKRVALSDFAGQVVLRYFWSTTSPYASDELSSTIDKLQRELLPRGLTVVAVTTTRSRWCPRST